MLSEQSQSGGLISAPVTPAATAVFAEGCRVSHLGHKGRQVSQPFRGSALESSIAMVCMNPADACCSRRFVEAAKIWVNDNIADYAKQLKGANVTNVGKIIVSSWGTVILRGSSNLGNFLSQETGRRDVVWKAAATLQLLSSSLPSYRR